MVKQRCVAKLMVIGLIICVSCLMVTLFFLTEKDAYTMERMAPSGSENSKWHSGVNTFCPGVDVLSSQKVNKLGQFPLRRTFLTIGISSITRTGTNYLLQTLKSLMENLSEEHIRDIYIVVFLADFNKAARRLQERTLAEILNKYVLKEVLHVIEAPAEFYPPLNNLKKKYNDSQERIRWRSKQNVDYSFLMCYCKDISSYYLHLEDDIKVAPSFFLKLRDFMFSQKMSWQSLDASMMGHIGKVYHSTDLGSVASLFYLMYDEMPVDWLMMYWRSITSGNPRDNFKFTFHTASLFEHLGVHSSLKEKVIMNSSERYFDKYDHKYLGLNPAAQVDSSFVLYRGEPRDAYVKGIGYFWGKAVSKGDDITVSFETPVQIKEISVDTGSNLAPGDILKSADLQISKDFHCSTFESIGNFRNGKIHVFVGRTATCLRVVVSENQGSWVFVREINVWTK